MEDLRFESLNRTKTKSITCVVNGSGKIIAIEYWEKSGNVERTNLVRLSDIRFENSVTEFVNKYYQRVAQEEFEKFTLSLSKAELNKYFKLGYVPK